MDEFRSAVGRCWLTPTKVKLPCCCRLSCGGSGQSEVILPDLNFCIVSKMVPVPTASKSGVKIGGKLQHHIFSVLSKSSVVLKCFVLYLRVEFLLSVRVKLVARLLGWCSASAYSIKLRCNL